MATAPHDWESDPRPFREVLQDWRARRGWTRAQAAAELRVPQSTLAGWLVGRGCNHQPAIRRLMTLIELFHAI